MFPGYIPAMHYAMGTATDPAGKAAYLLKQGSAVMLVTWKDGSILTYTAPTANSVQIIEFGDRAYGAVDSEDLIMRRLVQANPIDKPFIEYLLEEVPA